MAKLYIITILMADLFQGVDPGIFKRGVLFRPQTSGVHIFIEVLS